MMVEKVMLGKEQHIKLIRHKTRKFILFFLAASIVGLVMIWTCLLTPMNSLATLPLRSIDVSDLSDRTKWYKVNQIPYVISPQVNILCAAPNLTRTSQNPHDRAAITVYVNHLGIKAMVSPRSILFPTGSVIVKKKVDPRALDDVLLYTVMIKNKLAFNPKAGGWEFATISGNPPQIQSRGDLASCMECHMQQQQNDYVFRTYRRS
jgi:Cytochrome P460